MLAGRRSEFLARYEGRLALGAALLATILFGALALLRHWTFHSTASDLAVFDQVMWNTVHGRFMESTISLARCEPHSFFGDHFSPALLLSLLDLVCTPQLAGVMLSEFVPARDRNDESLAIVLWLMEWLLLRRYE